MSSLNQFDLLGADDNDDPSQLLAAAQAAAAKKALANKPEAAPAGKAAQTGAAAKLPTKPAPPGQAARDARNGGPPSRGGFGRGEPGRGRGGGRYGQNRDYGSENTNGYQGGYGGDGAVTGGGDGERGPRPPYRGGGGRRGGYRNSEFGDDSERPPRRNYERHSGTGRGQGMKRDGAGRGNWGSSTDEGLAQETDEALKIEDSAPSAEKQGEQDDAPPTTEENKDQKDGAAKEEEENEEDKEMTLEEYEKIREEQRKALLALKTEERKVEVDKDLQSLQPLSTKKANDEIFIKLGSDKEKKKESTERDERAKKSLSINEFLKPAEGERYYGGRGRGRGRGEGRGVRGGFGGGYQRGQAAAPSIEDQSQFPTLGGK
ncbi:hypothetical protein ZWY2020_004745 [Hordeum vulgare]|nr:hypothetical protein ZWY2020_004745 [Hordeum vulgare]